MHAIASEREAWLAMSETRIKIVSNPYSKSIGFKRWDGGWQEISYATDPASGLVSEEIANGFFPFTAKRIVELIVKEYGKNVTVVFEGPEDEFNDLCLACAEGGMRPKRGERRLANASDALPKIVNVFRRAEPLIEKSGIDRSGIDSDIEKFIDVSKDQVPICVIGNYSAGKSSFINALIGYEYLPSGIEAVTAKVFRITRCDQANHAAIAFGSDDCLQELWIESAGLVTAKSKGDRAFIEKVADRLDRDPTKDGLVAQVHTVLELLNTFTVYEEGQVTVPDLIRLEVPFNPIDSWMDCSNFVIIDTPGSNSSTNVDHARVLREAMEGLSDGLLVFLALPKTLDTIDNAKLCSAAKTMDAMDDRFTMVVVNSADQIQCPLEGFSAKHEQRVLAQTIPKELKPQGIYYVSSPVALGAKTEGGFVDDNTQWHFEDLQKRFSDTEDDHYTELYRCNILPAHLKQRANSESEACGNRLLANSGLYTVEGEIALFARKYSAFNKCERAVTILKRIIGGAARVLQEETEQLNEELDESRKKLERDKASTMEAIRICEREEEDRVVQGYDDEVLSRLDCDQWTISLDKLKSKEDEYTRYISLDNNLEEAESSAKDAQKSARVNLAARLADAAKTRKAAALQDLFHGTVNDAERVRESREKLDARRRDVDRQAADLVLAYVRDRFSRGFEVMASDVEVRSKRYWRRAAAEVRAALYETATGSTSLPEEKIQEIGEVIISFPELELSTNAEALFNRSDLEESLRLFNFVLIESERLNLRKVRDTYNDQMRTAFRDAVGTARRSHSGSFFSWLDSLMSDINDNITSYNPMLQDYVESIRAHLASVQKHEEILRELDDCLQTVTQLIDWRERG